MEISMQTRAALDYLTNYTTDQSVMDAGKVVKETVQLLKQEIRTLTEERDFMSRNLKCINSMYEGMEGEG